MLEVWLRTLLGNLVGVVAEAVVEVVALHPGPVVLAISSFNWPQS